MARTTPRRSYGIETMADAVFTLERSDDPAHRAMAADCHAYGPTKMVDTARALARSRLDPADAA